MFMVLFETALAHEPFPDAVRVSVRLPAEISAGLGV
jgi:hypothetical protein